jgi:hypothetical protein
MSGGDLVKPCAAPLADDVLVSYWAHDLAEDEAHRVEEHLFACEPCSAACAAIARVAEGIRALIPPVLDRTEVAALQARGLRVVENPVDLGTVRPAVFPSDADILLHALRGLDLRAARSVKVHVYDADTGNTMMRVDNVPFDAVGGEVLIACQRHFSIYPPNVGFDVSTIDANGLERTHRFVVPHVFP